MYADGTNLSTKVNKVSDISDQLIPEFTNILNWLKENRLGLNFIKTKFMLIGSVQKYIPSIILLQLEWMVDCSKELKELYTLGQLLMRILRGMTILTTFR